MRGEYCVAADQWELTWLDTGDLELSWCGPGDRGDLRSRERYLEGGSSAVLPFNTEHGDVVSDRIR